MYLGHLFVQNQKPPFDIFCTRNICLSIPLIPRQHANSLHLQKSRSNSQKQKYKSTASFLLQTNIFRETSDYSPNGLKSRVTQKSNFVQIKENSNFGSPTGQLDKYIFVSNRAKFTFNKYLTLRHERLLKLTDLNQHYITPIWNFLRSEHSTFLMNQLYANRDDLCGFVLY